jgi:hypothetical protein
MIYDRPVDFTGPPPPASPSETDVDMSIPTMDRDMSRGMGQLLRNPNRLRPPFSRARAANLGPSVLAASDDVPTPGDVLPSTPDVESPTSLSGSRLRQPKRVTKPSPSQLGPAPKRPVKERWFYEPFPSLHGVSSLPPVPSHLVVPDKPTSLSPLVSRDAWMMDGDSRSDAQADAEWRQTTQSLFAPGKLLPGEMGYHSLPTFGEVAPIPVPAALPEFGELLPGFGELASTSPPATPHLLPFAATLSTVFHSPEALAYLALPSFDAATAFDVIRILPVPKFTTNGEFPPRPW